MRILKNLKKNVILIFNPEPEVKEDYINKIVTLLRRDFNAKDQNEIILSVGQKLSKLRAEDMKKMEENYQDLQKNTNILAQKMTIEV